MVSSKTETDVDRAPILITPLKSQRVKIQRTPMLEAGKTTASTESESKTIKVLASIRGTGLRVSVMAKVS